MINAQETINSMKKEQEEEIVTEEEVVEEVIAEEEVEEEAVTEETIEETTEEEISAEDEEEQPKDNKGWAKMRHKIKERDGQIDNLQKTLDEMKLQLAQQQGFQDAQIKAEPQVNTDPEPDSLLDPEEHTAWSLRQMQKENEDLRTTQTQHTALIQNQQDRQSIAMLENRFSQANPDIDYDASEKFLKDREAKILKLQYPDATTSQIDAHIDDFKVNMFKQMAASGRDASTIIVEMAKENGFETAKQAGVKKKPSFQALKKNQEKNASLIGGSDAAKEHNVTSEQIFNMSMSDLASGGKVLFDKAHKNP